MYKCTNNAAAKEIPVDIAVACPSPLNNANNVAAKKVLCWHWIKSPAPLPQSQIWGHVCQVQVRIFNAMSLYHHPAYTLYLVYALCIAKHTTFKKIQYFGAKRDRVRIWEKYTGTNKNKEKYFRIYFCRVVNFGSEDVGGGDVSSSSCHSDRHTPQLSHSRPCFALKYAETKTITNRWAANNSEVKKKGLALYV